MLDVADKYIAVLIHGDPTPIVELPVERLTFRGGKSGAGAFVAEGPPRGRRQRCSGRHPPGFRDRSNHKRVLCFADGLRLIEAVLLEVVDSDRRAAAAAIDLVDCSPAVAPVAATAVENGEDWFDNTAAYVACIDSC